MISILFNREFVSSSLLKEKGLKGFISLTGKVFMALIFLAIEIYMFWAVNQKLEKYQGFSDSFLILAYSAMSTAGILFIMNCSYKVFFKKKEEREILGPLPLSRMDIVAGKSLFILGMSFLFSLFFIFPLSITYGVIYSKSITFYFLSLLGIVFDSLIISSLGMIISIPYREIRNIIERIPFLLIVVSVALSFLLAYVYSLLLNFFVNLVVNSNMETLFQVDSLERFKSITSLIIPWTNIIKFSNGINSISNLFVSLLVGLFLAFIFPLLFYPYYVYFMRKANLNDESFFGIKSPIKTTSPLIALLKKELTLSLYKDDDSFSFVSVVCVEPFLIYLVISAVNVIFTIGNFNYIRLLVPNFVLFVDVLLLFLFISFLNGEGSSLNKEKGTLDVMKSIPVSINKQLMIKVTVPSVLSFIFYFISLLVLALTKEIQWTHFLLLVPAGAALILFLNLDGLVSQIRFLSSESLNSFIFSFLIPLLIVSVSYLFSMIPGIPSTDKELVFLGLLLSLLTFGLLASFLRNRRQLERYFLSYRG